LRRTLSMRIVMAMAVTLALGALVAAAACGGDEAGAPPGSTATPTPTSEAAAPGSTAALVQRLRPSVAHVLSEAGIRFLVVEHLPHTRLDGACFWLDPESPVVALSLRYDRGDWFWHTLIHELGHVERRHGLEQGEPPVDVDLFGRRPSAGGAEKPEIEREADAFAARTLIPPEELENFIARVGPLYSQQKIRGFAERLRVHPGIVVGQLQFHSEIDYSQHRRMLTPVRDIITQAALTDGWGHTVPA